eukprot:g12073.t1
MRYRHEEKVYDSRWEDVTAAFWQKYPNPSAPNVKSVDPIARELDEANKVLKLRRLMSLEYQMPGWMERIFGCKMTGLALEETTVDYANKILELKSRNLGLLRFLRTEETCRFEVHPDSPEKTRYTTTLGADGAPAGAVTPPAASSSSSWACGFGLQAVLENQFLSRAKEKAKVGFEVMKEKIEQTKNPEWPGFVSREQWERFVAEESELLRHKKDELREQICQKTQEWEKAVEDTILEKKESLREKKEEFCKTWSAKTDELLHEVEDLKSEVERKVSEGMKSVSGAGGGGCCGELSSSPSLAEGDEPQAQPVAGNGAGSSGGGANMGSIFRKNVRAWLPFVTRLT